MNNSSISIIVPVYNEEKAITEFLKSIKKTIENTGREYEIVVVNDGSTDNSLEEIQKVLPDANILKHEKNKGYGAALKTGIRKAENDLIVIIDADGTYSIEELPRLLEHIENYDMVIGKREYTQIPVIRRPAKWLLKQLADYLIGTKIPDINSGFRVFRKNVILKYFNILPSGFSFSTTSTLALLSNDYSVKYVTITYSKRKGKSKIRPVKDTLNFIQLIIRTVLYFNPLKVFLPASIFLFLLGLGVLFYSYFFTPKVMDITTIVIFMTAIQVAALGLLADLIDKRTQR